MIQDNYIRVFRREFPLCDVAQGQMWDTPISQKGIPQAAAHGVHLLIVTVDESGKVVCVRSR